MLVTKQEKLRDEIRVLADHHGREHASLIPMLQDIQSKHHHVSDLAMQVIANELGLHPVEVYSVVSFYSFLTEKPKGRFTIRLCQTLSCDMAGKDAVARQLSSDLGIEFGQTTADGRFTLEWTNCMGLCDQGPAMMINDRLYTQVTPQKIHDILEECRETFGVFATNRIEEKPA